MASPVFSRYRVTTARLVLRPLRPSDAGELTTAVYGAPLVAQHLPPDTAEALVRSSKSIERYSKYWDEYGHGPWAITLRDTGEFIGRGGLKPFPETDDVELIYALSPSHWGKGLALEAAQASVRFGFEILRTKRIVAYTGTTNTRSQRVLTALHFRFIDVVKSDYYELPHSLYVLAREDWTSASDTYDVEVAP